MLTFGETPFIQQELQQKFLFTKMVNGKEIELIMFMRDIVWASYDQGCSVQWGSNGSSTTSNAKNATSCHDDNGYFGWYSLNAVHKIRIGVNIYSYYQQINPCQ